MRNGHIVSLVMGYPPFYIGTSLYYWSGHHLLHRRYTSADASDRQWPHLATSQNNERMRRYWPVRRLHRNRNYFIMIKFDITGTMKVDTSIPGAYTSTRNEVETGFVLIAEDPTMEIVSVTDWIWRQARSKG
jgi:hypothetical protein